EGAFAPTSPPDTPGQGDADGPHDPAKPAVSDRLSLVIPQPRRTALRYSQRYSPDRIAESRYAAMSANVFGNRRGSAQPLVPQCIPARNTAGSRRARLRYSQPAELH